jgi:Alternative complex III, ActD subunit
MSDVIVVGTFVNEDECAEGITALHQAHVRDFRAYSPIPSEKIAEAASEARGLGRSPVRIWVLIGGITGFLAGLALTVGTSWEWNLNTGGKPVASIPPYIIIMFELMILTGGLMGLLGFFLHSRLPAFESEIGFRSRFEADKFGVVVRCNESDASRLETLLRNSGAENVTREPVQEAA